MHFGLFSLMAQRDRAVTPRQLYQEMVEQVKLAEPLASTSPGSPSIISPTTACVRRHWRWRLRWRRRRRRIRLGTAVIVAPLYHPLRMLEEIGMLDVISDGRAVIGLGTGYQQYEFHRFGVSLENARDTFLETLDVVEQYMSGGPVQYEGKAIRIPETHFVVHPIQQSAGRLCRGPGARSGHAGARCRAWLCADIHDRMELRRTDAETRDLVTAANTHAKGDKLRAPYAMQRYVFVTDDKAGGAACRGSRALYPPRGDVDAEQCRSAGWRVLAGDAGCR